MTLGRLKKIELRDIWATEAQDFTPWLASEENLTLLGEALDLELELRGQEVSVGPFRADILCTNTDDGSDVLVENQLERTDHNHLGQLLTYAAGLHTVTIVWVAAKFQEDHRAALDWLNEITDERFRFFGLEIELWKIGTSPAAPKFNIVSKPNDWSRAAAKAATNSDLSERLSRYQEFWKGFAEHMNAAGSVVRPQSPRPQHWMTFGVGRSGFALSARLSFQKGEIGASFETLMDGKEAFDSFYEQRETIAASLGYEPDWQRLDKKKMTRIASSQKFDVSDETQWIHCYEWLADKLGRLNSTFRPLVRDL